MNNQRLSTTDSARSRLRATIATMERQISRLRLNDGVDDKTIAVDGLASSFTDLVNQLALGPEPELRECPVCSHLGMRTATLCGYCWTRLTPVTDGEPLADAEEK